MPPGVISSQLFFAVRFSPLLSPRLSTKILSLVRILDIALNPPTKRGKRGGKLNRRNLSSRKFLFCGLLNARSLSASKFIVQHHIIHNNIDLLAVTETWLTLDNGEEILRSVCPSGYLSLHNPRIGRRGGGLAIIYRSSMRVILVNLAVSTLTFEFLAASFSVNSSSFLLLVIYRPPSSNINQFFDEFATFLESIATSSGKLLIVGDFNIHVDDSSNPVFHKFLSLIDSFDILQHVMDPTPSWWTLPRPRPFSSIR